MLTCQQLTEIVTDYLEGRLSFMDRVRLHMHLGMCGRCRTYLRQMKLTVRTLGELPAAPIPAEVRDELLTRFRGMRPPNGPAALPPLWPTRLLAALEKAIGARRGWMVVASVLAASAFSLLLSGAGPGPLLDGRACLRTDLLAVLGGGAVPLALVVSLAWRTGSRLSSGGLAASASLGAFVGYLALQASCKMALVAPHVLVFHVGGILLVTAAGAAASRLPAVRSPRSMVSSR